MAAKRFFYGHVQRGDERLPTSAWWFNSALHDWFEGVEARRSLPGKAQFDSGRGTEPPSVRCGSHLATLTHASETLASTSNWPVGVRVGMMAPQMSGLIP